MAYKYGTCKNCWEPISKFVSTVMESNGLWFHVNGGTACAPTYAEPAD